jgi:hypothetical protein
VLVDGAAHGPHRNEPAGQGSAARRRPDGRWCHHSEACRRGQRGGRVRLPHRRLQDPRSPRRRIAEFRRYARELQPEADRYGLDLSSAPLVEDDDSWQDKLDLLLADPVPVVSVTFGLPRPAEIAACSAPAAGCW